jgi:predicted secreted protein
MRRQARERRCQSTDQKIIKNKVGLLKLAEMLGSVHSARLRAWCEENRNRCYIPEWLLDAWDIHVDTDHVSAA